MPAPLYLAMMVLIIAHRGASGDAPENTLAAFQRAIERGADLIELDIQFTRDKRIVVLHDETVQRTTNGRGSVAELTQEQIRALDAGSWFSNRFKGEKVPTLEEVIALVKPTPVNLLIEIKEGSGLPSGFEEGLIEILRRSSMQSRVIIQSFNHSAVRAVKEKDPSLNTAILINYRSSDPIAEVHRAGAEILAIRSNFVSKQLVEKAHESDIKVFVWTVNREAKIREMFEFGVDGIITDYPERVQKIKANLDIVATPKRTKRS